MHVNDGLGTQMWEHLFYCNEVIMPYSGLNGKANKSFPVTPVQANAISALLESDKSR